VGGSGFGEHVQPRSFAQKVQRAVWRFSRLGGLLNLGRVAFGLQLPPPPVGVVGAIRLDAEALLGAHQGFLGAAFAVRPRFDEVGCRPWAGSENAGQPVRGLAASPWRGIA